MDGAPVVCGGLREERARKFSEPVGLMFECEFECGTALGSSWQRWPMLRFMHR